MDHEQEKSESYFADRAEMVLNESWLSGQVNGTRLVIQQSQSFARLIRANREAPPLNSFQQKLLAQYSAAKRMGPVSKIRQPNRHF